VAAIRGARLTPGIDILQDFKQVLESIFISTSSGLLA
jgi:hypothetical protein